MKAVYGAATALLRALPPETAHDLTIRILSSGLAPDLRGKARPSLAMSLCGLDFPNPIGLAAGFDKNAEAYQSAFALGFGFVEVGTVTPRPQPGNPKPRLFRLGKDQAVINRMGFNNDGLDAVVRRIEASPPNGILGVNLGKNKDSEDAVADYRVGVERTADLASYLVINVSSPNTPGLRELQHKEQLTRLIAEVRSARDRVKPHAPPPLFLKVAPDLTPLQIDDMSNLAVGGAVEGLIISNTTVDRPATLSAFNGEAGGLSGQPLFKPSTDILRRFADATAGKVPLIGVGGIASGTQAHTKIVAGASLVQLYSALVFRGPGLVSMISEELARFLERDGLPSIADAIGSG